MKPYIITHMMQSVDGRIDCAMTELIDSSNSYYDALDKIGCSSQLMGRVSMQMHYADPEPYVAADKTPIGRKALHAATRSKGYTIAMDTHGTLRWCDAEQDGRPLIVVTSEDCPKEYLDYLTDRHISWIAVGKERIDLKQAMDMLRGEFGVGRIAITGGGHINGAFLEAGLIDEVSVMIGPGIDGRKGMAAVFDGIENADHAPTLLRLESVEKIETGTIWLRYKVVNRD